ncbi:hypothetical protein SOASR030_24690 [Leminorella grimontii]|uniref:DUF2612 domain-containing protein n=1 Tax=Leminorella grimontii TaxID=82981 RepID=A0AAV5N7J4_9GAMM|nr:DUF2612 domain-containing protein [Leminorella grimontii]KFC95047.1 hypothetical protein GLGR_2115 [Leminorella grimontii ATCC 33999 = DSM 5078]GKX56357.1 hypothetical protein SOASR030_24690 [Leminorella grimontii]VFS54577.1 Protein of uncharacterised function (DUF2612) [Leminorella grimontii]
MTIPFRQTALSRLVGQFHDKEKVKGLVESMVAPLEAISDDLDAIKHRRWVDTAEGAQLDGCGYIVGVARQSRGDEEYRTAIKSRILSNSSRARPQDLIEGVRFLTKATEVQYLESYPACALLFSNGKTVPQGSQAILQDIAPAAIENVPLIVSYGRTEPLRTGRLSNPSGLSVSNEQGDAELQVNNEGLSVSGSNPIGSARLSGMVPAKTPLLANRAKIRAAKGILAVSTTYEVFDNGYRLPGVFQ